MRHLLRFMALAAVLVAVAGCASGARVARDGGAVLSQADRAARLDAMPRWSLTGRIAVSDGRDGGSGRLEWMQDGPHFDIAVRAPVASGSWRLSGDGLVAQIDGLGPEPLRDVDAEALLAREIGWHLPMAQVAAWVRALPADAAGARIEPGQDGLPAILREAGWTVEYRAWTAADGIPMPRRLVARRAPFEVRIAIERWSLHGGD
jgi:outer membrane lipoprotein LolB